MNFTILRAPHLLFINLVTDCFPALALGLEKPEADIPAFDIECGCDWEEEHGMEIIIKGDELLYIGEYAGLGPWADKECYECIF